MFVSIQELRKQLTKHFYETPKEVFIQQENTCTFTHTQSNMSENILRDDMQPQVTGNTVFLTGVPLFDHTIVYTVNKKTILNGTVTCTRCFYTN